MFTFFLLQGKVLLSPLLPALIQFEEAMLFRLLPAGEWAQDSLQPPSAPAPAPAKATQGQGRGRQGSRLSGNFPEGLYYAKKLQVTETQGSENRSHRWSLWLWEDWGCGAGVQCLPSMSPQHQKEKGGRKSGKGWELRGHPAGKHRKETERG